MSQGIIKRALYQGAYRQELETPVEQPQETETDDTNLGPEEKTWKKRYGDARTYINKLTEENKKLNTQLIAANKKEIKIPSTKEELDSFVQRYPDVARHIRSLAMQEILTQKEDLEQETKLVQDNLSRLTREAAEKKILAAHPDFHQINDSDEFHEWASTQPKSIQNLVYESEDPDDCIAGIDLYKATLKPKAPTKPRSSGADTLVRTKSPVNPTDDGGKKIWKTSEIGKLTPRQYEKLEAEIELAREEGRIEFDAR